MRLAVAVVLVFALGAACPPPLDAPCEVAETRCAENQVQVCNARSRWQLVADCAEVDADRDFTCQRMGTGAHACL